MRGMWLWAAHLQFLAEGGADERPPGRGVGLHHPLDLELRQHLDEGLAGGLHVAVEALHGRLAGREVVAERRGDDEQAVQLPQAGTEHQQRARDHALRPWSTGTGVSIVQGSYLMGRT